MNLDGPGLRVSRATSATILTVLITGWVLVLGGCVVPFFAHPPLTPQPWYFVAWAVFLLGHNVLVWWGTNGRFRLFGTAITMMCLVGALIAFRTDAAHPLSPTWPHDVTPVALPGFIAAGVLTWVIVAVRARRTSKETVE
ncbi:hypothetical protein ACX3O0_14095 [Homoserinimonas sp. A447]